MNKLVLRVFRSRFLLRDLLVCETEIMHIVCVGIHSSKIIEV